LGKIVKAVASGQRVVCVAAASPRPSGLAEAISRAVSSDLSFEVVHHDLSRRDQTEATAHLLAEVLDVPAAEVASVADFASHSDLVDQVVIIDGIDRKHLRRWSLFLRHLNSQANTSSVVGPVLIVMLPNGLSRDEYLEISGGKAISTLGISDRYDSVGYVAGIGIRPSDDLPARVGHAVVLDVAAWSRECLERMCVWDVVDQIEPLTLLQRAAESVEYPYPCWENGLVDRWDDEPVAHAFAAARHGLTDHLKRRIWSGQASVLLPFTFRILRATIARYLDVLERSVSPSRPLVKNYHGHEKWIVDPWELEFHDVRIFVQDIMPRGEVDMLKIAGAVRNAVAHHKILDADTVAGPIVDEFKRVQSEEGEEAALRFLAAEADGFHATPYGYCLNSFTVDPCPKHLECFNGCRHLAISEDKTHQMNLEKIEHQFSTALMAIEARKSTSIGRKNQLADVQRKLANVRMARSAERGKRPFPDGPDLSVGSGKNRTVLDD
jgi:hypothetical protein